MNDPLAEPPINFENFVYFSSGAPTCPKSGDCSEKKMKNASTLLFLAFLFVSNGCTTEESVVIRR